MNLFKIHDISDIDKILFMDCEFTCWEKCTDDFRSNRNRLPEIIEIGFAAYDLQYGKIMETFFSFVKPRNNFMLSDYCKLLLNLSQDTIDKSFPLPHVCQQIVGFLKDREYVTCAWGMEDRNILSQDACGSGASDPLKGFDHIDIMAEAIRFYGFDKNIIEREEIQKVADLNHVQHNHNALDDAIELIEIFNIIRKER